MTGLTAFREITGIMLLLVLLVLLDWLGDASG